MTGPTRRRVLAGAAASASALGLAGCLGTGFPGSRGPPDRTVYVGAYHWGFLLLDEDGTERESVLFKPGARVRLVAYNTEAHEAIEALPEAVRAALPDHEALEERNEQRVPEPPDGDVHAALEEANERYPDHSLAVMPSGYNRMPMGGGMNSGMMLHPVPLPADATRPTTAGLAANERGDYTLTCLAYCGYGHPYMELDGAFVVP